MPGQEDVVDYQRDHRLKGELHHPVPGDALSDGRPACSEHKGHGHGDEHQHDDGGVERLDRAGRDEHDTRGQPAGHAEAQGVAVEHGVRLPPEALQVHHHDQDHRLNRGEDYHVHHVGREAHGDHREEQDRTGDHPDYQQYEERGIAEERLLDLRIRVVADPQVHEDQRGTYAQQHREAEYPIHVIGMCGGILMLAGGPIGHPVHQLVVVMDDHARPLAPAARVAAFRIHPHAAGYADGSPRAALLADPALGAHLGAYEGLHRPLEDPPDVALVRSVHGHLAAAEQPTPGPAPTKASRRMDVSSSSISFSTAARIFLLLW